MRKMNAKDAAVIRERYIQGDESLNTLAREYDVSYKTLSKRSAAEQWSRRRAAYKERAAAAKGGGQIEAIRECAADALLSMKNALETATDVDDIYTIVRALKVTADIEFKTGGRLTPGEQARYEIELGRLEAENMRKGGANEICVRWADDTLRALAE